eukprot:2833017-Pyramimonas_sp.AAC.1
MPGNAVPGEEGRVAEVAQGKNPARSYEQKMVQKTARGEAWLAFQLLQKSTKTPPVKPNYMVPNRARFFRVKADRPRADPTATVAVRLNWAKLSVDTHRVGVAHCVELSLPFFVTGEKIAEVLDPPAGWTKQSHGASVTVHSRNIGGYGGHVKAHAVGVYSFPCVDNSNTHATHSVAEETFGDGTWATAEVVFFIRKPKVIKGHPPQYVSDPTGAVLHGLRLYHWTPAALHVTNAYVHVQNVARQNGWNLEQNFEVERYRDDDRTEATDTVWEAQMAW